MILSVSDREIVTLSDGGLLCLEWSEPEEGVKRHENRLVLFLPGLTGGSDANYARMPCHIANQLGYTAAVMNYRGYAVPLKVSKNVHPCGSLSVTVLSKLML